MDIACDDNNAANPRSGIDSETPIPWENRARDRAAGGSSTRHTQELADYYSSGGQRRDTHGISRHQYPLLCLHRKPNFTYTYCGVNACLA